MINRVQLQEEKHSPKLMQKVKSIPPIKQKYIETPNKLWEFFLDYVSFERENPMFKTEYAGKDGEEKKTPLTVPITFEGFECYLSDEGIIEDLGHYAANTANQYEAYCTIIGRIRKNCFVQNFKGASVGLFNANLIAKKLGLVEKIQEDGSKEVTIKVKYERKDNKPE